ncbi:MAG TPA: hypothetical protein VIO16_05230 [Dehalococcoidia bacterium]
MSRGTGAYRQPLVGARPRSRSFAHELRPEQTNCHFIVRVVGEVGVLRRLRRIDTLNEASMEEALLHLVDLVARVDDRLSYTMFGTSDDGLRVHFADLKPGHETDKLLARLLELRFVNDGPWPWPRAQSEEPGLQEVGDPA